MEKSHIWIMGCLLAGISVLACSCIKDDCDHCDDCEEQTTDRLIVKAVDSDPQDIQNHVSLYLFDDNLQLERIIKTQLNTLIEIQRAENKSYTIVGLGYTSQLSLPHLPVGTKIEQAQLILQTSSFAGNTIATSPGDLFHGTFNLAGKPDAITYTVWISRKVAALTIITHNLQAGLNTTDTDFSYVVSDTYDTFDFTGTLKGNKISYHPQAGFDATNHNFVATKSYTYAATNPGNFCVHIYKGASLLRTYCSDKDGNPLLLVEGKHTVVLIDFSNEGSDTSTDVTLKVLEWGEEYLEEGFN